MQVPGSLHVAVNRKVAAAGAGAHAAFGSPQTYRTRSRLDISIATAGKSGINTAAAGLRFERQRNVLPLDTAAAGVSVGLRADVAQADISRTGVDVHAFPQTFNSDIA